MTIKECEHSSMKFNPSSSWCFAKGRRLPPTRAEVVVDLVAYPLIQVELGMLACNRTVAIVELAQSVYICGVSARILLSNSG